ncbi:MAG: hypothetical protein J6I76_18685 [Oribacterium sp.]|nr:hypothetical protein [Oribacterium sp.]
MKLTDEMRERIWSHTDINGMAVPCVGDGYHIVHFCDLPKKQRSAACRWLVINIRSAKHGASTSYIKSHELSRLLCHFTGINLTNEQVQEALLLLGTEPWDIAGQDWTYRISRDCPCSGIDPDGCGNLLEKDRSCHVSGSL